MATTKDRVKELFDALTNAGYKAHWSSAECLKLDSAVKANADKVKAVAGIVEAIAPNAVTNLSRHAIWGAVGVFVGIENDFIFVEL